MNTPLFRLASIAAFTSCIVLLAANSGCQSKADFDRSRWAQWTGTEAGVAGLNKEVEVLGIKIRPPKNFVAQPVVDGPENSKITSWIQRRENGSVRAVQLMVMPIREGMEVPTNIRLLDELFSSVRRGKGSGLKEDSPSRGFVNDIEFARTSWNYVSRGFEGDSAAGHFYVSISDNKVYQLATQDTQDAPAEDLEVCHASILSFKQ